MNITVNISELFKVASFQLNTLIPGVQHEGSWMKCWLFVSSISDIHKQTNSLTLESKLCEASYLCHHVATIFLTVAIVNCYFNSRILCFCFFCSYCLIFFFIFLLWFLKCIYLLVVVKVKTNKYTIKKL